MKFNISRWSTVWEYRLPQGFRAPQWLKRKRATISFLWPWSFKAKSCCFAPCKLSDCRTQPTSTSVPWLQSLCRISLHLFFLCLTKKTTEAKSGCWLGAVWRSVRFIWNWKTVHGQKFQQVTWFPVSQAEQRFVEFEIFGWTLDCYFGVQVLRQLTCFCVLWTDKKAHHFLEGKLVKYTFDWLEWFSFFDKRKKKAVSICLEFCVSTSF